MINGDVKMIETLVDGHDRISKGRRGLWSDIASKYLCDTLEGDNDGPRTLADPVENGALFAVVDTKVAATTPQRPRGSFTPSRQESPYIDYALARERLVAHVFRQRQYELTLKRINALARITSHAFLKASWDWKRQMPRFDVLDPLCCWFDEAAESPEDITYVIRRKWLRKHEMQDLVNAGIYSGHLLAAHPNPGFRDPESRLVETPMDKILPVYEVFEIHDYHDGSVYHWSRVAPQEFLLAQRESEQLFNERPFYCLSFNEFVASQRGLSDGEILRNPVERLSRMDALEYAFMKAMVPDLCFNPEAFVNPELARAALTKPRVPGRILDLALRPGFTWEQALSRTPSPVLGVQFESAHNRASEDSAYRAGLPAYSRGQSGSKVATELALQQQSEATRRAWDVLKMQGLITFAATSTIGLYEEHLPENAVIATATDDGSGRVTQVREVYRATLGFRDPDLYAWQKETGQSHEDAVSYFYVPDPYDDPMAGSPQSRIAQAMQLYQAAVAVPGGPLNPWYQGEILRRELHEAPDFLNPQPQAGAPGAAPPGAMPELPAPGGDPVTAGGAPAGVPSIPTPAVGPMAGGAGHPAPTPKGAGITL